MSQRPSNDSSVHGLAGRIAHAFIDSKLTPLIVFASVLLGAFAVLMLPREEEPQIQVPMMDVMVVMPGSSAREVEERATRPMEKLLWEVPGVEYLYSQSREGEALTIVRFKVGSDPDASLVKVSEKLRANRDRMPHGVDFPLIKPRSIDDVPILALTFHSGRYDHLTLRRLVSQVDDAVKQVPWVAETTVIGGARRELRVLLDPARLASRGLSPVGIIPMMQQANRQFRSGELTSMNQSIVIETGAFLQTAEDVRNVVVGTVGGRPIYLREVAEVVDGPEEPSNYVFFGAGPASTNAPSTREEPAVTLAIGKRPGANAVSVAENVLQKVESLKGIVIPADVTVSVTRHYGETAAEKSNELLLHMGIAVVSVSLLIWLTLGWRESGIVAVAIPATLALTLLVFYLYGFTLNRITLFALIFSIGILVDDAIVVVENIVRHFHLTQNRNRSWNTIAVEAVSEVGNPTILATFAVIAAVLPMAFVGGLMGPYMRPIPVGASAAMFWSLLIAFIVTPWASIRMLRWFGGEARLATVHAGGDSSSSGGSEDALTRLYRKVMDPLLHHPLWQWTFLGIITALLLGAMSTVAVGGESVDLLHVPREKEDVNLVLQLPRSARVRPEELLALRVRSGDANALPEPGGTQVGPSLVPLRELVRIEKGFVEKSRHRKNLMPVNYVIGDVAGVIESPVYAIAAMNKKLEALPGKPRIHNASMPISDADPAIKWDGEWHITLEVFRDLGIAFAAVLVLIYVLMVGWFRSFLTPLLVMLAIPFSLVGILPAHGAMGAFFTATSMIGFMAGAGIVVRNSIILVDFIEQGLRDGMPLDQAVIEAGAVRFRPMVLTAAAVIVGAAVILADPIFQGLAISLMAGEVASLLISRMAVPVLYFMAHRRSKSEMSRSKPL